MDTTFVWKLGICMEMYNNFVWMAMVGMDISGSIF